MAAEDDMQLRLELEDEKRLEEDYEELLKQEAERMSVRDYQPKVTFSINIFVSELHNY